MKLHILACFSNTLFPLIAAGDSNKRPPPLSNNRRVWELAERNMRRVFNIEDNSDTSVYVCDIDINAEL